jgi:hypothetical protein
VLGNRGGVDSRPWVALGVRGKVGRRGREQERSWAREVGEESDKWVPPGREKKQGEGRGGELRWTGLRWPGWPPGVGPVGLACPFF